MDEQLARYLIEKYFRGQGGGGPALLDDASSGALALGLRPELAGALPTPPPQVAPPLPWGPPAAGKDPLDLELRRRLGVGLGPSSIPQGRPMVEMDWGLGVLGPGPPQRPPPPEITPPYAMPPEPFVGPQLPEGEARPLMPDLAPQLAPQAPGPTTPLDPTSRAELGTAPHSGAEAMRARELLERLRELRARERRDITLDEIGQNLHRAGDLIATPIAKGASYQATPPPVGGSAAGRAANDLLEEYSLTQSVDAEDANSPFSRSLQELVRRAMGIDLSGVPGSQIQQALPMLSQVARIGAAGEQAKVFRQDKLRDVKLKAASDFDADPEVRAAKKMLSSAKRIVSLLETRTPTADKALTTFIPRMLGEVGNLATFDVKRHDKRDGIANTINDSFAKWFTGTLSDDHRSQLRDMTLQLDALGKQGLQEYAEDFADRFAGAWGDEVPREEFFSAMLPGGRRYRIISPSGIPYEGQGAPPDDLPAGWTVEEY